MLNQLLWKKIVQNILQPSSWVYSKYIWDLQVLLGVVQLVHLNFFPQATASIHVKEEFGDVNCFFLSVAKIIYKISLLLTRCSRQEGLKLQKTAASLLVQRCGSSCCFPFVRCEGYQCWEWYPFLEKQQHEKSQLFPKTKHTSCAWGGRVLWNYFSGCK